MRMLGPLSERAWRHGSSLYLLIPACDLQLLAALQKRLEQLLRRPVGMAAAESPTLAHIAAKTALGRDPIIVDRGQEQDFLSSTPLHLVIDDRRALRRLSLLGISTLGDLASVDPALTAIHLGRRAERLIRLARGEEILPIPPAPSEATVHRGIAFPEPPEDLQSLLQHLTPSIKLAASKLRSKGMRPFRLELKLQLGEGYTRHIQLQLTPNDNIRTILKRMTDLLIGMDLSGQISSAHLALSGRIPREEQPPLLPMEAHVHSEGITALDQRFQVRGIAIEVTTDKRGHPTAFTLEGRIHRIVETVDRWRADLGWWDERIARDFFKVITSDGSLWTLSHDLLSREWRIERLHD